ncbi:unnamed protein product [Coffea canephora]|uniref:Uncharacterized protein n=1 Tax=Coffea canephora TaxID=49390 RepID=A0A068U3X9_COFCA|nr:unnamed protein product [Coffea canephora]
MLDSRSLVCFPLYLRLDPIVCRRCCHQPPRPAGRGQIVGDDCWIRSNKIGKNVVVESEFQSM